ncbi:F-box/kelch-repeat protein At3g23880-like [Mercurialis annua]|uniref:F-box/kelch-repeat protein At3g23880-like n=1 Tax=Mercurialis annua TaxID=3986 RepID=UPI00216055AD|nr:F-box/kelch-repeat protein At3g23880-like [Mercurialis annua]
MVDCPNFVEEILVEILLRLPIKSIVRFKAVHSSWLSFLSSTEFTLEHLRRNKANATYKYGVVGVENITPRSSSLSFRNLVTVTKDDIAVMKIKQVKHIARVYGSCNGLLLVQKIDELVVWNPSTAEYKSVRTFNFVTFYNLVNHNNPIFGIGYDDLNDNYKIIFGVISHSSKSEVEVYSMKTGSWEKKVYNFPYIVSESSCTTLANGTPHWIGRRADRYEKVVLFFDTIKEEFKELVLPQYYGEFDQRISVLDGDLCLATSDGSFVKVWVMKEYDMVKSWCKLDINYPLHPDGIRPYRFFFMPVGFANDDNQVVIEFNKKAIAIYGRIRNNRIGYRDVVHLQIGVAAYIETLVSPNYNSHSQHKFL